MPPPHSDDPRVEILDYQAAYRGYFHIDRYTVKHHKHEGGWTPPLMREVMERGNSVTVLPYDPVRDSVVLIEQFRIGAFAAGMEAWQTEIVAGIVEPGESPEDVARREAVEEAGCEVRDLELIGKILMSSGACTEVCTMFCGRVDAHGVGGIHGVPEEGEDIRATVVPAQSAIAQVESGEIHTGYAIIPLQWLALNRERLRQAWS